MALLPKRWIRSRRFQLLGLATASYLIYVMVLNWTVLIVNTDVARRYIDGQLEEALKTDKGSGCEIPQLDPFDKEVMKFDKDLPKVECDGMDWVKCYHAECKVKKSILKVTDNVVCTYRDIIYVNDLNYHLGSPHKVYGENPYILTNSDHVVVECTGKRSGSLLSSDWKGVAIGYRNTVIPKRPSLGREHTYNVLIFGFDSTSKNAFIRRMPKSYDYLLGEMNATLLNGYNILGDGTPAALFPILSGKNELEFPDARKKTSNNNTLDANQFIFSKMQEDGYRTAYFEDSPSIGTFQYRFNGFSRQPADHFLRAFFLEDENMPGKNKAYCVGDKPRYRLMMDITRQFLELDGKKYIFTFIADITHNDFNQISTADEDTVEFLKNFKNSRRTKDTILFVMGDHGARYAGVRETLQGRLEERLPLMAIRLPDDLVSRRPAALTALQENKDTLTTPHDIYATILDALDLTSLTNPYRIQGADLPRSLSLLRTIPKSRSCSEAGIEPHWCACLSWAPLVKEDPMWQRAADALVAYINELTYSVRSECAERTLTSISWVMKKKYKDGVLSFERAKDMDGYFGVFGPTIPVEKETYQAKITVGPGIGVFEGSLTYKKSEDRFEVNIRDISRTNMYNHEPDCIHRTHPHLNMFCYCKDQILS